MMIDKLARLLGKPNTASTQPDRSISRRSLISRITQASAAALLAGGAASTITLRAGAQLDPCQSCYGATGCSDFYTYYYCDDRGQGYKCCICADNDYPYPRVCGEYCVPWQAGCYRTDQ